ncbi:MAG: antibiotic biosynthesis monooxygenase [Vicinamibacterales bacterium]
MLLASLTFRVQSFKRTEALSTAEGLVELMRDAVGCTRSRMLVDADDDSAVLIASEWTNTAAAEKFFSSGAFRSFCGIRILMRGAPADRRASWA